MEKIKVLEVNNVDLFGRRFNGYDLLNSVKDEDNISIKQMVVYKESNNPNVKQILSNYRKMKTQEDLDRFQERLSIHSILSMTSPGLINSEEYKEADIIHFHMFHNTKLSLISLIQICNEKKVIISLHDPWLLTGRCVHFGDCNKWKNGCNNCEQLDTLFKFTKDNCHLMWKLKKLVYDNIKPSILVSSKYMYNMVKESPLTQNFTDVNIIPFGIDLEFFTDKIGKEEARRRFNIPENTDIVLFFRAQMSLKGTGHIIEALKKMETNKKITILTCDEIGLFDDLKDKYHIIERGMMSSEDLLYAYNACDIYLMPSKGETFGMMAVEAMACKRPVVIFDNTAMPEVTHAPKCGVLVENQNTEKLREAIEMLINNEEERIKRGELGRKICEENYNINEYQNKRINLYKKVYAENKVTGNNILNNINYKDQESLKIQNILNKFTEETFRKNSREFNQVIYKNIEEVEGDIDYSNLEVQKIINEYNNKLYDSIENVKSNKLITQLKNAMDMLVHDRERLKNSIQYKLNRLKKKKE